jgi:hypothetical protein
MRQTMQKVVPMFPPTRANVATLASTSAVPLDGQETSSSGDADSVALSMITAATSEVSLYSTPHSRQRLNDHGLQKVQLQAAKKHAPPSSWIRQPRNEQNGWKTDRLKVEWDGIVLITDESKKVVVTSWPVKGRAAGGGLSSR